MRKECDVLNTRVNYIINQTLCGCEEEEMSDLTYGPSSQKCSATSAHGTPRNHMSVHCADASSLSGLFLENSWTHWGHLVSCVTKTEHICRVAETIL